MVSELVPVGVESEIGAIPDLADLGVPGRVRELLPDVTSREEQGRIYQDMWDNDPTIGAVGFAIEMMMRQAESHFEPYSKMPADRNRAKFAEEAWRDCSHTPQDFVSETMTMLPHGWSWFESCYKYRDGANGQYASKYNDGKVGWRKFAIRPQSSLREFDIDSKGGIQGMWQNIGRGFKKVFIPIGKSIHFRTSRHYNNPYGRSILRNAYRPWYFKKRFENLEGIGVERDLAGMPIAWVPPSILKENATTEEKAVLASIVQIVENVRWDEQGGLVFPLAYDQNRNKIYDFSLLTPGGSKQIDTNPLIERLDRRIAGVVLADFLFTGQDRTGAFAKQVTDLNLWLTVLNSWLGLFAETFNTYEMPRFLRLNGYDTARPPKLVFERLDQKSAREVGDLIARLGQIGVELFPEDGGDEELETYVRKTAGMPPRREGQKPWRQKQQAKGQGGAAKINPERTGGGRIAGDGATGNG
jgi:hypothetical protein